MASVTPFDASSVGAMMEIDICVTLKGRSNLPIFLLIENKLDTSEQVNQAESYQAEAKLLVADGIAQAALHHPHLPERLRNRARYVRFEVRPQRFIRGHH